MLQTEIGQNEKNPKPIPLFDQTYPYEPEFIVGNALDVIRSLDRESVDCCLTSPPYWSQRAYESGGIGLENTYQQYVNDLCKIFGEMKRVLKQTGSLWLNLGDVYENKDLVGLPWRVAFELKDRHGFILRNSVIWNKIKGGMDQSKDKLRNNHELIFHFVLDSKKYYYNIDAVRQKPRESKVVNGAVVSATGVSGIRYRRQIELSTSLSPSEKSAAIKALDGILQEISVGNLSDFRMIIRGQQRATHSNEEKVSGRARELREKGFYFLKYHPNGSKPSDVWDILPEDTQKREGHFAPYPEDLCKVPILTTCPPNGTVIDPFCGTGTTNIVAKRFRRKSIGIDISQKYVDIATERCRKVEVCLWEE